MSNIYYWYIGTKVLNYCCIAILILCELWLNVELIGPYCGCVTVVETSSTLMSRIFVGSFCYRLGWPSCYRVSASPYLLSALWLMHEPTLLSLSGQGLLITLKTMDARVLFCLQFYWFAAHGTRRISLHKYLLCHFLKYMVINLFYPPSA